MYMEPIGICLMLQVTKCWRQLSNIFQCFGRGGKAPTPTLSVLLRNPARFSTGRVVLTKDPKWPYEGRFCGSIDREWSGKAESVGQGPSPSSKHCHGAVVLRCPRACPSQPQRLRVQLSEPISWKSLLLCSQHHSITQKGVHTHLLKAWEHEHWFL